MEGKDGHPWDVIRNKHIRRLHSDNRYADVRFVLDRLPQWFEGYPDIGGIVDLDNMAMSGHSFWCADDASDRGHEISDKEGNLLDLSDARIKSGLLYSPGSIEHLGDLDPQLVYPSINIPLLHMTGTEDGSPLSDLGYEIRLAVFDNTDTERYLLVLKDGDHMVFNGSRGKLGAKSVS